MDIALIVLSFSLVAAAAIVAFALAVVSGRPIAQLDELLGDAPYAVAGEHVAIGHRQHRLARDLGTGSARFPSHGCQSGDHNGSSRVVSCLPRPGRGPLVTDISLRTHPARDEPGSKRGDAPCTRQVTILARCSPPSADA